MASAPPCFGSDISLALRDDVIVDDFHPCLREGAFISFHPANPGTDLRSTNEIARLSFSALLDSLEPK